MDELARGTRRGNDGVGDTAQLGDEIAGLHLRTGPWTGNRIDKDTVEFTRKLPRWDLELVKQYKLARLPDKPDASSPPGSPRTPITR